MITSLICPKCSSAMETVKFEQVTVDRCRACGGLWFDVMEQRFLRELPGSESIDCGDVDRGREMNERKRVDCPRCHTPMTYLRDTDRRDIEYEYCPLCNGAFYDAGEFRRLQQRRLLTTLRQWLANSEQFDRV